jgi:D-alanyl-lipoteichoic acid acyltransferase DltB (MBOAT superfamily)
MGNVMVVFVVSGLWHGASWTYVIWGGLHGIYLVIERLTKDARDHAWKASRIEWLRPTVSTLATFHLVLLAWVFFRADSLSDAVYVIRALPYCLSGHPSQGNSQVTTLISLVVILMLVVVETVQETATRGSSLFEAIWRPLPVRWCAYVSLIIGILLLGVSSNGFIYGKF